MISKEQFKTLVDTVCLSKNMTQGELSRDMGYGENYISEMLTEKGKLTEKFYSAFKIRYAGILENPKIPSKQSLDNLTEVILILTRNNERLTKILEANSIGTASASEPSGRKSTALPDHEEHKEEFLGKSRIHLKGKKKVYKKDISD